MYFEYLEQVHRTQKSVELQYMILGESDTAQNEKKS